MTLKTADENLDEKLPNAFHAKQSLRAWLRLLSCSTRVEKTVRARLKSTFNTTLPRFDVLAALYRADGGMTMSELSTQLLVSNGNVTGIVQRLFEEGLVVKSVSESDRRAQRVMLTKKGRRQFSKMAAVHEEWIDAMFAEFSSAEMAVLYDSLGKLKSSIAAEEAGEAEED